MKELEIRTNGEVLQANMPVGQITFLRPFIEGELAGLWLPEGCDEDSIEDMRDEIDGLEGEVSGLERDLKIERQLVADLRKKIAELVRT